MRCLALGDLQRRIGEAQSRYAPGAAVIIEDGGGQALALRLGGERHERRRAAAGRVRAALEVVAHYRLVAGRLIEVPKRVHAAGKYQKVAPQSLLG